MGISAFMRREQLIDRLIDQPRTYGHLVLPDPDALAEVGDHRFPGPFHGAIV